MNVWKKNMKHIWHNNEEKAGNSNQILIAMKSRKRGSEENQKTSGRLNKGENK